MQESSGCIASTLYAAAILNIGLLRSQRFLLTFGGPYDDRNPRARVKEVINAFS
jgi:hypothetical protein